MDLDRLTDWLLCLRTPLVQAYAVRHERGVSLIDTSTAGNADAILAALKASVPLHDILLTHGHADHTGSAAALVEMTGARVLAPATEVDIIEGRRPHEAPRLQEWERPIYEHVMPQVPAAPPVTVDVQLAGHERLPWSREAYVVPAPGHTRGQLAVWFPQDRVLVAADAIACFEGSPMPGGFNVDPVQAEETYYTLAALDPEIACFGHGEPLVGAAGERLRQRTRSAAA